MKKIIFFLGISATLSAEVPAKPWELLAFSIGPVVALQSKGNTISEFVNYTPRYNFSENLYARANLGFSLFKNKAESNFFVVDFAALGGYYFTQNLGAELGLGFQSFTGGNGGTSFALTGNMVYRLSNKLLFVDRFNAGYTLVALSNALTHEIRLSVGVNF